MVVVVALGIFMTKKLASQKKAPERRGPVAGVRVVNTLEVENGKVQSVIPITGKLTAAQKMDVVAEVPGRMLPTRTAFKEGNRFGAGSTLIQLDNEEIRMNLLAARAGFQTSITQMMPDIKLDYPASAEGWQNYLDNLDVNKPLAALPEPKSEQERYFLSGRNIHQQYYNIKASEERLQKYTFSAPYSGIVTQSNVDPGMMVVTGQKLGEFLNPNSYELEAAVSVSDVKYLKLGDKVALRSNNLNEEFEGRIKRISNKIDPATQTLRVFVSVSGPALKEGMYLHGKILSEEVENAIAIPRKLLEDKQLYVIQDSVLALKPVEVVKISLETAIVRGLKDGQVLLNENLVGAYEGMKVKPLKKKQKAG